MTPPATPFFLPTAAGLRYCLFHAPQGECRGALLYVHPFADEMNKSRRVAHLQARALAERGYGVLLLDLHGCGDSDGDFADASWDGWKNDIAAGCAWLQKTLGQAPRLWGLRLGALLALDYANSAPHPLPGLLLWQPVASGADGRGARAEPPGDRGARSGRRDAHPGAAFLTQFLRLRLASDMLGAQGGDGGGTRAFRAALERGEALEIAGYILSPALAQAIDALDLATMAPACPAHWFELVASEDRPVPPAAARISALWPACVTQAVAGPPFWSTQEVAEAPALLAATCAALP